MSRINCYIPIKLRITGRLSDAQLDQLGEELVRALAARISFAEGTVNNGQPVSATYVVDDAKERLEPSLLANTSYEVASYGRGDTSARVPVLAGSLPLLSDFHDYAFFFTGGPYGRAAEAYIMEFFPDHHRYHARSFEQMFSILARDIRRRRRRSRRRVYVSEIVIVTHANAAGGMKIPLTRDRRRRTFTPWDLAELQREFRRGLQQRFRRERREVVAALDENTQIIVRGCNFGQSQDGLNALRLFFGGQPIVFAPMGFQGFEVLRVGGSLLRTPEQAFDFLVEQGYMPPDLEGLSVEEKQRYIRNVFGGRIPAEFFVMSENDYDRFKQLPRRQRLGPQAETLVRRPFEADEPGIDASIPSGGRFWSFSAPSILGNDPELDQLSTEEIEARARRLNNPYRSQNAAMLLRLRAARERKSLELPLSTQILDDPLAGLPDIMIFGDSNLLAGDAARYPDDALRPRDLFEEEDLPFQAPTSEQREQARDFEEVERVFEATASVGLPHVSEKGFSSRGRVETISDGIRLWNFGVSSSRLRTEFHAPLREIARRTSANPNLRIGVQGHTSSSGSRSSNQRLSIARANAVQQFLTDAGVPASQIEVQGFGEENLLVSERGRDGQLIPQRTARNRRVEVYLVDGASSSRVVRRRGLSEAVSGRGRVLGREGRREQPSDETDALSAGLTIAEITASVIAHIVSSFAVSFIATMASWIFSFIGLVVALNEAQNRQIKAARKLGIRLGLKAAGDLLRTSRLLAGNITARQLESIVHRNQWLEREWLAQVTYSYPLGPDGARRHMRQGLARVAQEINRAMRWAEREFRRRLSEAGLQPDEVESVHNAEIDALRRRLLGELIRAGLRALN